MNSARYKWSVVGMLWFICFFNYADRQTISSVFPLLQREFGFNAWQLGLIGSAFMWVYAFGAPFAGYIADRVARKNLILGGCLFWSLATAATGWCSRLWQLIAVRALEGFGGTFYFPASMSLVSDYHGGKTRSKALSFHQSSVYIGTIAGSWFGAWIAERLGWRSAFYFFGGAGLLVSLLLLRFLREPVRGAAEAAEAGMAVRAEEPLGAWEAGRAVLRQPLALDLMGVFLGVNLVATVFLVWTPTFLFEKFHFKLAAAGLSGSVFIQLASAVGCPLGGVMADVFSRRHGGGRVFVQAAGLLVGAPFVALVGLTPNVFSLLAGMVVFGLCKGLYDSNIFASLYDVIEPRARGTAAGLMNAIGWMGGALGPVSVGFATQYGRHAGDPMANMSEAIAAGSVLYLAGGIVLLAAGLARGRGKKSSAIR